MLVQQIVDDVGANYGDVAAEELRELQEQVEHLTYQPTELVDTIFIEIDILSEVTKLAKKSLTKAQKIDITYLLLQKVKKYKSDLNVWNCRTAATKTWTAFKIEMREAQKALRYICELIVQDNINQVENVNMIAEGI
eukprot:6593151-Ditylum_brightwellii.AAC.1